VAQPFTLTRELEEKIWGWIMVQEKQHFSGDMMGNEQHANFSKIRIPYYNINYFPRCRLTFCVKFDVCKQKVCNWLIEELGPSAQKFCPKGWKR
jgi:hypothetical protein